MSLGWSVSQQQLCPSACRQASRFKAFWWGNRAAKLQSCWGSCAGRRAARVQAEYSRGLEKHATQYQTCGLCTVLGARFGAGGLKRGVLCVSACSALDRAVCNAKMMTSV